MCQVNVKRPSRISVAFIYFKRLVRWRRNSYPYISGDAFADMADYVYQPPRWRNFNKVPLGKAKSIFVESQKLQEFLNEYGDEIQASVIITGNSDHEFHTSLENVPVSVKAIFLQNSFISDNVRYFSIPLGIENFRWGVNGNPKFIKNRELVGSLKSKILFGPLGKTHPTREIVTRNFSSESKYWDFFQDRINPQNFDNLSKQYSYVAAVRGNGIDTHRLWESLYRGILPIVEKSAWWDSLKIYFPEVKTVDSWTHENILKLLSENEFSKNISNNPALWMPFWENKIGNFLN